ncbi:hypothetical protein ACJVC5_13550 [Peredibacter sp. HCB2-198]|uniref:hypothetical protein n=1 Tax=Peredibacter sp. HCB2-198 TaxID=3383025 RepID=UPI0038B62C3E
MDLQINNHLFRRGGVIGRLNYLKNMMIIFLLSFAILLALSYIPTENDFVFSALLGLSLVLSIGIYCVGLINSFKRLRDLRGTTYNETPYQVITAVLLTIPYVSIIPLGILLFAEGAVTGHGSVFGRLEKVMSNDRLEESDEEKEAKKIDNLSRLYQLKETGGITEDEYKHYKDDVFKKSA